MAGRCNSCGTPSVDELLEAILAQLICDTGGLEVDEALRCIRVALAPGGGLEFDALGRLRNNCCDGSEPIPGACVATVGGLGDFVHAGAAGGAYLLHPQGSPQALDYALDHALDMVMGTTWSTADEVAVWQVYGPEVPLDLYTTSPTTAAGGGVMSSDWISLHVDAGTTESPTGRNAYAPSQHIDPDGGWYGWYAPQYQPLTLAGVLRRLQQRIVTFAQIDNTSDGAQAQRNVTAALRAVSTACTHDSTILGVNYDMAAYVETIENAQVTPAIYVDAGETDVTADQVAATGVEWVRLSASWSEAQIAPFIAAGLNVILLTGARHWSTLRAQALGARGIASNDPVYARGALGEIYQYYRRPTISYVRRQTEIGHLTTMTDLQGVVDARGFTKSTEYGLFTWVTEDRPRNSILIGGACPLPDPETGSYTFEAQVDAPGGPLPTGESPKIGVTICQPDDQDTAPESGNGSGYACFVRVGTESTGQLEIGKLVPGAPYEVLATSTTSQAVPPNDWMTFRIEISPTALTLTRTDTATPYSVTTTDTQFRGPYVSWLANKVPGNPAGDFVAGVRQFVDANASMEGTSVPEPPVVEARRIRDVLTSDVMI